MCPRVLIADNTGDGVDSAPQQFWFDGGVLAANGGPGMLIPSSGPTKGGRITAREFLGNHGGASKL